MAFEERRVLREVSILPGRGTVHVQWSQQVLRDGQVIAETFERKSYNSEQASQFAVEVEGAANYLPALGWTPTAP